MGDAPDSPVEPLIHEVTVEEDQGGERLDVLVAAGVQGVSRSAAQRLIKGDHVRVDARRRPQGYRVQAGSVLTVTIPPPEPGSVPAHGGGDLDILYEDDSLVVVNKPHGMVVHPGAGHRSGTLADNLLASGRALSVIGGEDRAGLVHRLDRDTSGVVLVAKDDGTHEALARQFKERTVRKAYLALVLGISLPRHEVITTQFGRRHGDRKQFTGRVKSGREAVTEYTTLACANLCALVLVHPRTGRTHQIRVHLAERGNPVVGDRTYGRAYPRRGSRPEAEREALGTLKRHALHALALRFIHPGTGQAQVVKAPLPRDMRDAIQSVFGPEWLEDLPEDPFDTLGK